MIPFDFFFIVRKKTDFNDDNFSKFVISFVFNSNALTRAAAVSRGTAYVDALPHAAEKLYVYYDSGPPGTARTGPGGSDLYDRPHCQEAPAKHG